MQIMRQRQLAILVIIHHRDHLVRRAGEDSLFQYAPGGQQPILDVDINWPLANIRYPAQMKPMSDFIRSNSSEKLTFGCGV